MPGYNRLQGSSLPGFFIVLRLAQGLLALLIAILTSIAAGKLTGGTDPKYLVTYLLALRAVPCLTTA